LSEGESTPGADRGLQMIVCVKQIPEMADMKFDHDRKVLIREGVRNILNPFDRRAVAEALRIKSLLGGQVTVMTMGPPQAKEALLECLAAGANRAIHLLDPAFAGADTLATARALAESIKRMPFDLIFCGRYSVDAETGQVGPEVAELLDIPHVGGVCKLKFADEPGYVIAERETDEGFETIKCKLPALITAAERLVKPIKVKEPDMEAVKDAHVEVVTAADLSSDSSAYGLAGSPTRVSEITSMETHRSVCMIAGDADEVARSLTDRLCESGLFGKWLEALHRQPDLAPSHPEGATTDKAIWVLCETIAGGLRGVTLELLGKARELSHQLKGEVVAVVIGDNKDRSYIDELASHGADRVYILGGADLSDHNPIRYANALGSAIERLKPHAVLIPSTANGRDYAPRVAARLGLGLTADCVGLALNEQDELVQFKPAFGGQIVAPILSSTFPQMATVRPGMLAKPKPDRSRSCVVEELTEAIADDTRYQVLEKVAADGRASAELDDAEVVVCVGMGIGSPERLREIEVLAEVLGAAIGGTRRVVDQGWLPRQQQIGITGRNVSPKIYLGIGVRGAFNHTIGIHRSGIVVAINSEPQADIFKCADYGIVADFAEVLPALTRVLLERKAELIDASSA